VKVLHLISGGDSGGAKTHVLSLLQDLNKNITADLVCFMEGEFSHEAEERGIPLTVFDCGFMSAYKKTSAMIKSGGYDLVHCHGSRANLMGSMLKKSFDIPFISTVHSDYKLDYLGRPAAKMTYGVLNARSLRKMDYHVCVSDKMRDTLIERGFEPNNMFAIYNGVDFSVPVIKTDRSEWFKSVGCDFKPDDIVVGIAARLDPVKDVATTVRGFARAAEKCEKLRLLIAGDGQEMEMLRALAEKLGISDRAFFAGWLNDMTGFFSAVDINVISSISETFPYAVTEAARAKIPTVSSRVGGVPKLIIHGETGMLFEPGDDKVLADCLTAMYADEDLRNKFGEAVYEKALKEFSTESTCRRQLEIYKTILRREAKRKADKRDGVIICGAYGHGNAGDEAILTAIIRSLLGLYPDIKITVVSRNPELTRREHGVSAIGRTDYRTLKKAFRKCELYINGGGSLIQNVTSRRSLWYYLNTITLAKKCGCKILMYGCGIGPITGEKDIVKTAKVLNSCVDVITLREPHSAELLKAIGVTEPEVILTADPVFSLRPSTEAETERFMLENGMEVNGRYICFGLRPWTGFDERVPDIAAAARHAYEAHGLTPVFLPMNYGIDLVPSETVARQAGVPYIMLPKLDDMSLAIGLMSRMEAVSAMRLHTLLFAASGGVPIVGISYDPKVSSFVEYIHGGVCIELNELTSEKLIADIDKVLSEKSHCDRLSEIREKEKINPMTAARFLDLNERKN